MYHSLLEAGVFKDKPSYYFIIFIYEIYLKHVKYE